MTRPDAHPEAEPRASLDRYAVGYALSILLTLCSFFVAPLLGSFAAPAIILAATLQLFVQLVCFLHLGRGGSAWNRYLLAFTAIIIFVLVGGTLWIMTNLAHLHVHEPSGTELYQNGVVAPQNELY